MSVKRKTASPKPSPSSESGTRTRKKRTAKKKAGGKPSVKKKANGSSSTTIPGGGGVTKKKAAAGLSSFSPEEEAAKGSRKKRKFKPMGRNEEIVYPEFGVALFSDDKELSDDGPLTVTIAKEYLGWEEEGEGVKFDKLFLLRDLEGNKVRCTNNQCNRPFRMTQAKDLALEMLRKKHHLTNETVGIDRLGMVKDGQHTLIGLVIAEQMRQRNKEKWKEFWNSPIYLNRLVVTGMSESKEVANVLGTGMRRTPADSLFCMYDQLPFFDAADFFLGLSYKQRSSVTKTISHAAKLVWLREGGNVVSFAPKLPHSELFEFIEKHARILESVQYILESEGENKAISPFVNLGFAAGLLYLMAGCATDKEEAYSESREESDIDFGYWETACDFWSSFADELEKTKPLRDKLVTIDPGGGIGRDEICGTVIKAWNLYVDGKKITKANVAVKREKTEEGRPSLAETPRVGGIDVDLAVE